MTEDRKKDAREKITLGGLVVKAGLRQADRAFLLGVLLEAGTVRVGSAEHHRLKVKGGMAFRRDRMKGAEAADAGSPVSDGSETTNGE
ncbi:conjugal transfer protein TraD [Pseudaminobacter sp. 19-2017]|uniref:Conjugal transfer protein TraD n=1 Tax=Pseudaminobacter soli (ex Zhang et al. 2022) TaxID=2831468 RepID=A0A942E2S6_9HYPH|nr:conjugal transfer protein TraD [Pseudaminobacter soli]MBS3651892.1 conjugal transfer protein TraD [Pseudaminobacter soli]